jgi:class 3 adenylate cyclase
MFSDLVGSTALSARMDPADPREVISAYQSCVAETVRRFGGGFVAKYIGDGVLSEIAASGQSPACRPIATLGALYAANSSSNALASFRSGVLKPSVNQS